MSSSTYIELPLDDGGAPGTVDSFNGRTGVVVSQAGDYTAAMISYNNTTSGLTATNVQTAIDELASEIQTSASPGFSFGRAGVLTQNTYLLCETVPSNVSGRWVYINSAFVRKVFISNETSGPFTLDVYYHSGNNVGETLLGSVTVSSGVGGYFNVNWSVPSNKQLSVKVAATSTNTLKNAVCGLELTGST
jgi:hypothetical protein